MTLARDNPFRLDRVLTIRYRPAGTTLDALADRFERTPGGAAIVGPHGSGKTTLLEDLSQVLRQRRTPVIELSPDDLNAGLDRSRALSPGSTLTLDGAGRLNWRGRIAARRASHTHKLLLTSHVPYWLPTLWTCRTTPALLIEIARELADVDLGSELAAELFRKYQGNLREALAGLYDLHAANLESPRKTLPQF